MAGPCSYLVAGTRVLESSNQFSTTWICGALGLPDADCPAAMAETNLPSRVMSYGRRTSGEAPGNGRGSATGFPKVKAGCVVTLTDSNWPGPGL